jgi:hypothetical protein
MEFIVAYLKPFLVKSNRLLHAALVSVGLFKGFARGKMRAITHVGTGLCGGHVDAVPAGWS